MVIDLTDIEIENDERIYIKKEGIFVLKVVKITEGKTSNNNKQIKVHFQDRNGHFAIDEFVIVKNSLWALKVLSKALKLPNIIDTNMFIDRYVKATIKAEPTQNGGVVYKIKKYEPSNLTNTYIAQHPKVVYEDERGQSQQQLNQRVEQIKEKLADEFDDDEIPF